MGRAIYNEDRTKSLGVLTDSVGDYIKHPNGVKEYFFTTAITANSTATTAAAGSWGRTSHATGNGKTFKSDGSLWQNV